MKLLNNGSKVEVNTFKLNLLLILICFLFVTFVIPANMAFAYTAVSTPLIELAEVKDPKSSPVEEDDEEGDDDC